MVRRTHPVTELSADSRWTRKTWIPQASFNPLQRHTQTSSEQPTEVLTLKMLTAADRRPT